MIHTSSVLFCFALSTSGCSAAKGALGILSPKQPPVSVVTTVSVSGPAVSDRVRGRTAMEKVGIVTTATVAGGAVGAIVGGVIDHDVGKSALLGASIGAVAGVTATKL